MTMVDIKLNEDEMKQLYIKKLDEYIHKINLETTFWDTKELQRQTCMSWNTILKTFFYDPGFPKYKVGRTWKFPAEETKKFLLTWLKEQK
ncbi:MAG: group-specific protein [Sporolactobacillus sp.]|jgi:hypothetical protein|nr:group-specific protein [Sporolactobacillus sp.]